MAVSGRILSAPLFLLSLASVIVVLGLAAKRKDITFLGARITHRKDLDGWQGNLATIDVVTSALTAGVVAVGAYIVGLHHLRVQTKESGSAAQAAAWIAFGLLILPFAYVWKAIALGGYRGDKVIALESFVVILTFVHFAYTLTLYRPLAE